MTKKARIRYIDGYVLPVSKKTLSAYRKIAQKTGAIWKSMRHWSISNVPASEDLDNECGTPYPRLLKLKRGETAVFAWIVFKSRAHRDRINDKVIEDPRLLKMFDPKKPIFDFKRMSFGGFTVMVDA